mmetsp:Transcript_100965/g.175294  ORF Transcript_100965/g.175294 Transcript_100965/m.175294 type:complete len:499 (+) Transcript_100965:105-1601(+)
MPPGLRGKVGKTHGEIRGLNMVQLAGIWRSTNQGEVWTILADGKLLKNGQPAAAHECFSDSANLTRSDGWRVNRRHSSTKYLVWVHSKAAFSVAWERVGDLLVPEGNLDPASSSTASGNHAQPVTESSGTGTPHPASSSRASGKRVNSATESGLSGTKETTAKPSPSRKRLRPPRQASKASALVQRNVQARYAKLLEEEIYVPLSPSASSSSLPRPKAEPNKEAPRLKTEPDKQVVKEESLLVLDDDQDPLQSRVGLGIDDDNDQEITISVRPHASAAVTDSAAPLGPEVKLEVGSPEPETGPSKQVGGAGESAAERDARAMPPPPVPPPRAGSAAEEARRHQSSGVAELVPAVNGSLHVGASSLAANRIAATNHAAVTTLCSGTLRLLRYKDIGTRTTFRFVVLTKKELRWWKTEADFRDSHQHHGQIELKDILGVRIIDMKPHLFSHGVTVCTRSSSPGRLHELGFLVEGGPEEASTWHAQLLTALVERPTSSSSP